MRIVRNWLRTHSDFGMPSAEQMLRRFTRFRRQLPAMCQRLHLNPNSLIFVDYAALVAEWLAVNLVAYLRESARGRRSEFEPATQIS